MNDCRLLQSDLHALNAWADNFGLNFNICICRSISFFKIQSPLKFNHNLYDTILANVNNAVNDLGITFDRELHFHDHIEKLCCKALKTLGLNKKVL